ncbi:chromate resistance protein ChrB domain-containing protein [Chitinophaga alhagiae]|uniref:chromate resistance protein ChrB domain-containing protein n=1 Tax=Chitinophaga alhagiae TaxID=2203219 RepID=UPI000E5B0F86|nr:chromate resistance protein ChrB domain-containing protein [Chitinophaga alhagiae]
MKWVTRQRPAAGGIACSWLIRRFIDTKAEFLFAPETAVTAVAGAAQAIPFDIPGAEYGPHDNRCTFDAFLEKHRPGEPALQALAAIVRGAGTDQRHLAPEAAGLWAIAAGLTHNIQDDHALLEQGMVIFDALYSWAQQPQPPARRHPELALMNMFHDLISRRYSDRQKKPEWVKEMAAVIQDQVDTNMALTLKDLSAMLELDDSYFEDHSFGGRMRRLRIEKALKLMEEEKYTLTEVAYLTGFSDQAHFSRVFGRFMGKTPTGHLKTIQAMKRKEGKG